jgi:arsenate reductase
MIKIYHNPRCSKSRKGLAYLEEKGLDVDVVKYLDNPPSREELIEIIAKLAIKPIQLVRKGEQIWKENFKGKDLNDAQIIAAMLENPKLIERPIIIKGDKAVIARPLENIDKLF